MKLRIGSRDSKLAVIQAQMVMEAIRAGDSSIEVELITMKTTGDKILNMTLDKIGGKGLFVKELDEALLDGRVDFTVHSYKDMPMEIDPRLPVVAVSEREDPRDALVYTADSIDPQALIGCSSSRRTIQLGALGFANVRPLRGNVQTRLAKLDRGEYGGIVLAAAGLKRLGLEDRIRRYFTPEEMLPASCQGILAVQTRQGTDCSVLAGFHSPQAMAISGAERAFVAALGGGCSSPIAAYGVLENDSLTLRGLYVDAQGNSFQGSISGPSALGPQLGQSLARQLKGESL